MRCWVVAALLITAGCSRAPATASQAPTALRIGLGESAGTNTDSESGLAQLVNNITSESLLLFQGNGRPAPVLASQWSYSPDRLSLQVVLREAAFHDGSPVDASVVQEIVEQRLQRLLGPAAEDVSAIDVTSPRELTFRLKRPTTLLLEALDAPIAKPGSPNLGSGAFRRRSDNDNAFLVANDRYAGGVPALSSIELKRYDSIRSAWADLLRGNVDMLYEVGVDALDSLEPSSRVRVFSYRRHYQYMALFNMRHSELRSAALRRGLNRAVDRPRLVEEALGGQGAPSAGPIWPDHWAVPRDLRPLDYAPERLAPAGQPLSFRLLIADPTHERLAIALQRQLRSVGIAAELEAPGTAEALKRIATGSFDLLLVDAISAPTLLRPYLFWHSKGSYNYGGYASPVVDAALDSIRHAVDDEAYKAGVAAFQRAVLDDPPAIFLAWSERARAVSTAFDVPAEPGRDPLSTLRLWRPAKPSAAAATN